MMGKGMHGTRALMKQRLECCENQTKRYVGECMGMESDEWGLVGWD